MNELETLSAFLSGITYEKLPDTVTAAAAKRIADTVGVAVGAANDAQIRAVLRTMLPNDTGSGLASVWGQNCKVSPQRAMFYNAMMAHTLELDDVHSHSKTHIGAVVVPAAWALSEALGKSGRALTEAVVCGYETASRIGMALGVSAHRSCGWHVTATAGVFGAAAACGRLLGLDAQKMAWALGMAGTQAFGLWAFLQDGATCKSLHPARAAANGCDAAYLALAGMSGPVSILTAEDGGMLKAMSTAYDVSLVSAGLGTEWEILQVDNKPYSSCRSTHSAIDAMLRLREEGLSPEQVESATVRTYRVAVKQCASSEGCLSPVNAFQAKFSLPYMSACALMDGCVSDAQFLPERISDRETRNLMSRIHVEEDAVLTSRYPEHWSAAVDVRCKDGTVRSTEITDPAGSIYRPLTEAQLFQKLVFHLSGVYPDRAETLARALIHAADCADISEIAL